MKTKEMLKELRSKSTKELSKELSEAKKKVVDYKKEMLQEKLKKSSLLSQSKKRVARIETVLREKVIAEIIQEKEESKK